MWGCCPADKISPTSDDALNRTHNMFCGLPNTVHLLINFSSAAALWYVLAVTAGFD